MGENRLEAWYPGWEHGAHCFPAFTPFNNENDNVDGCVRTDWRRGTQAGNTFPVFTLSVIMIMIIVVMINETMIMWMSTYWKCGTQDGAKCFLVSTIL